MFDIFTHISAYFISVLRKIFFIDCFSVVRIKLRVRLLLTIKLKKKKNLFVYYPYVRTVARMICMCVQNFRIYVFDLLAFVQQN